MHCVKQQLDGTDERIKLAGLDAVKNIAHHSPSLADHVADAGLLEKALALLQEPATSVELKSTVCNMLTACAAHTAELSRRVLDTGCVQPMVQLLGQQSSPETARVQVSALQCLAHMSSHETQCARLVADAGAAPAAASLTVSLNPTLRRSAASLLQQLAARTPHLCTTVATHGCVTALIAALRSDQGTQHALAPLMALGHIGSSAATFALAVSVGHLRNYFLGVLVCWTT